jgi:hypothetical protein
MADADISELREALGAIVANYTFIFEPYSDIKETSLLIRYIGAMLDALNRLDKIADEKRNLTYRDLLKEFRSQWKNAVNAYNAVTGAWKDSTILCSELMDNLMRIAVKEGLLSVSREMYNISQTGMGGIGGGMELVGGTEPVTDAGAGGRAQPRRVMRR